MEKCKSCDESVRSEGGGSTSKTESSYMVGLSKALSWLLRHGPAQNQVQLKDGGFVDVPLILGLPRFSMYSVDDIRNVVKTNDKQRYALREDPITGVLQIRANQGHTVEVVGLELTPILEASSYPEVIHGTYLKFWNSIRLFGLSRMKRRHIHLAAGKPGETGIISGMRSSADVLIYIDMRKAIADGIQFFLSANNVILTPGNENGILEQKYFVSVVNRRSGKILYPTK